MPAITGSSLGYAGEINEVTGKDFWNRIGASKYGVVGANDLKVTTTTGDRMLLVASGVAWGHNIQDTLDTSLSVQLSSVASGSRWDTIVIRRDATAGSSVEVITGTATKGLPSLNSGASHPDQPLALCRVQAGSTTVQEIIDLRCWAANGGVIAADKLALEYLNIPGADVHIGGLDYRYAPDSLGVFAWQARQTFFARWIASDTINFSNSPSGSKNISFPAGMFTVAPLVDVGKLTAQGAKLITYATNVTTSGCTIGAYSGDDDPYTLTLPVKVTVEQTSPNRAAGVNP